MLKLERQAEQERPTGKKNSARWCKGRVGREHTPVVQQINHYVPKSWPVNTGQQTDALHFVTCAVCGKKLKNLDWRDYPLTEVVNKR